MPLDYAVIEFDLKLARDEDGRGFYTELEKKSGVANIGRYARGDKQPSFNTWEALHNAMPERISAPCYKKDGLPAGMQSTGDNNRLVQTSSYVEQSAKFEKDYSPELLSLIDLLDEYGTKAEIRQLLRNWEKRRRDIEKM